MIAESTHFKVEGSCQPPSLVSLFDCRQLFASFRQPQDLIPRILDAIARTTRSTRAFLSTLDADQQSLVVQASTTGSAAGAAPGTRVRLGDGLAGWVAKHRRAILVTSEADLPADIRDRLRLEHSTSALCVPLEKGDVLLGALELVREGDVPPFTEQDEWFAVLIADWVGLVLYDNQLVSQLESQTRFINRIMESIPSSLLVIDRAQRIVSANRNFLEKGRRETRSTVGHKIEEVFPQVLLEYTRLDQRIAEVFRTGQDIEGGKVAYRAPGLPTRVYYYRLIPLKAGDSVENVMLLMDDITEREKLGEEVRRAERHLASVVDYASDLVISLSPSGSVVTWNPAAERAIGLKSEEVKGRLLRHFCVAEQASTMATMLHKVVRGEEVRNVEVKVLTAQGRELLIAWSCSPMRDDADAVVGIVAIGRDLTEARRLEAQITQSAKMASLGIMAGGIAHELRNPLAIISAGAQLLLENPNDLNLRTECATRIHGATQRASLIIENLLRFARPGGGKSGPTMTETDLRVALDETLTLLAHQMTLQKVILKEDLHDDLPLIRGNFEALQQVFANLVLNACNAMPHGGTLTVRSRTKGPHQVEVTFSDTGNGIAPEQLGKVFDPFFTTMPVGKGTGLGLSISYSIIQQHQGVIELESRPNQGTTVTVRLPIAS